MSAKLNYDSLLSLAEKKQEMNDIINGFNSKKKALNGRQASGPDKSAIEAFKARKAREEHDKYVKAQREKQRLLELRAHNAKSMKRSKMMTTRTKDNDFSRIVLTAEQIEEQRRVEEKLKKKGITDVCERMKTRIDLEEEEATVPKKRQRNKNNASNSGADIKSDAISTAISGLQKNKNNSKTRPQRPPPMSYEQLMNLASEKANTEKVSLAEEIVKEYEEKKKVRPMTQREKEELKEERFYKERADKGLVRLPNLAERKRNETIARQTSHSNVKDANKRTPNNQISNQKNNFNNNRSNLENSHNLSKSSRPSQQNKICANTINNSVKKQNNIRNNNSSLENDSKSIKSNFNDNISRLVSDIRQANGKEFALQQQKRPINKTSSNNGVNRPDVGLSNNPYNYNKPKVLDSKLMNQRKIIKQKEIEKPNRVPARAPSRSTSPQRKLPPIGSTYRRENYENVAQYVNDEYDEEDDDDMSDFIDDRPEQVPEEEDYSKHIREIFGYDKRKYRNIDDDDDDIEEANFAQCMKEESRSLRIGRQEDLEDMRKEEEEKRLKKMANKKSKR